MLRQHCKRASHQVKNQGYERFYSSVKSLREHRNKFERVRLLFVVCCLLSLWSDTNGHRDALLQFVFEEFGEFEKFGEFEGLKWFMWFMLSFGTSDWLTTASEPNKVEK